MSTFTRRWACALLVCLIGLALAPPDASPMPPIATAFQVRVFRFVDRSRRIRLPDGRYVPRPLETVVRYPTADGSFPLIVFAHGYMLTPARYDRLLRAWAETGYVVAAPVFPLENANAPGGPDESDLVNQPRDMSFVITKLLALSGRPTGVLGGKIDPSLVAVAGHSDGAETALAVAYDRRYHDPRVRAAIILAGAPLPGMGPFPGSGPPLLAVQGTGDTTNAPATTAEFFRRARRPKFLLWLLGASHLSPYTDRQPHLAIVQHTTVAFLDHYLKGDPLGTFRDAAQHPGLTRLSADP